MTNNSESWHLSKSVPVSLILALLLLTASAIQGSSAITSEVNNIKEDIKEDRRKYALKDDVAMRFELRDERISNITKMLDKIDKKLDKALEK